MRAQKAYVRLAAAKGGAPDGCSLLSGEQYTNQLDGCPRQGMGLYNQVHMAWATRDIDGIFYVRAHLPH